MYLDLRSVDLDLVPQCCLPVLLACCWLLLAAGLWLRPAGPAPAALRPPGAAWAGLL
jgi:hypothetical protein